VIGFTAAAAAGDLRGAGFHVSEQHRDTTRPNEQGIVLDQSPGAGRTVTKGSTVTIVVGHYKPPHHTTTTQHPPPTTTTSTTTTTTTTTSP
jgi:beta-lactam-binding protein with PASTA domain